MDGTDFEFEELGLWQDYSAVVDNPDGNADAKTNLNNFAGTCNL